MLQIENHTPFAAGLAALPDLDGREALYLVIRASFELGPAGLLAPAAEQPEPGLVDEYLGDPLGSSLSHASELHSGKQGTDVLMLGHARAPGGVPVEALDVSLSVAGRGKVVRVFGERRWRQGPRGFVPGAPAPFEAMPLIWERSYGGRGPSDPETGCYLAEARNPVGRGFAPGRREHELLAEPVPNLIDLRAPVEQLGQPAAPACFAYVAPSWEPRRSRAGTYDSRWQQTRAPYLPEDFQPAFFNAADPELCFEGGLTGGEPVQVRNASLRGVLAFNLPRLDFDLGVRHSRRRSRDCKLDARLETVVIEPDLERVSLSFRAVYPCDKHLLEVKHLSVNLNTMELN